MKTKVVTSALFVCSAMSTAWLALDSRNPLAIAAFAGFLVASASLFRMPRTGYALGMISGLMGLEWFRRIEFGYFPALNSWVTFNLSDYNARFATDGHQAKLRILFAVTVLTTTLCSIFRLLPAGWVVRKVPLRDRTWPAVALCLLLVSAWYLVSVSPYRIPLIVDGLPPELAILHVQKDGVHFRETSATVYRDGQFYIERNERRLFQYGFTAKSGAGRMSNAMADGVRALAQSSQLADIRTPPPVALRKWKAEGWYVRIRGRVLAFTTEYGTTPPEPVIDVFHTLESASLDARRVEIVRDVCMGFCYDPLAGLGLASLNARCTKGNGTRCN